ncbi:tRNA dimethylallyltransferase [Diutina catenulata]
MIPKPPNVVTIVGTTGVGKSQFSIDLAKAINGEIINADSMQVYKGLDQITNKHPVEERDGVPHHVMNHVDWTTVYDIHQFSQQANAAIEDILARGKVPIIIGGTHYYLQNLLFNNKTAGAEIEPVHQLTSDQLAVLDGSGDTLLGELMKHDPVIAQKFHPQDTRKLRRALEIYYTTGKRPSEVYHDQKLVELEQSSLKYRSLFFWVYCDRDVLVPRLDARVDKMMSQGAVEEVHELYDVYTKTNQPDCTSGVWQVIGFKEFLPWLASNPNDPGAFAEGVERMKIRTRQYAKYQIKWIKRLLSVELQKEARFNWNNGGKLYLLDASDLTQWQQSVSCVGINIAKQFIAGDAVDAAQAPDHLMHMFPTEQYLSTVSSNKQLGSAANWKHYACEVCKDGKGNPLVSVGEEQWKLHINSRRHRNTKYKREKKLQQLEHLRRQQGAVSAADDANSPN